MDDLTEEEKTAAKSDEEFLQLARDRFQRAQKASSTFRERATEAMKFVSGEQWLEENENLRKAEGRPCLTVNRVSQMVRLVANQINRSRPAMKVIPIDSDADVDTAEILMGIIRHIERNSDSSLVYGMATDNQIRCGLGYFGFTTRYATSEGFEQEVELRWFPNPLAVFCDPAAMEFDGSDQRFCFVIEKLSKDEYQDRWPDSDVAHGGFFASGSDRTDWMDQDTVTVAEYWYIEKTKRELVELNSGQVKWRDELKDKYSAEQLKEMIARRRDVEFRKVHRATINGFEVLMREEWPGSWIPIIPVYGEFVVVDGARKITGLIEYAKEPQRLLNYFVSCAAELIALAPKSPFIAAAGQIDQFQTEWDNANKVASSVLRYKPIDVAGVPVPPPQRTPFDPPIQSLVVGLAMAEDGVRHAVGLHAPSIGTISSERSGKAIAQLKEQGDLSTYHFVLNFARAIRFAVKQLIGDGEHPGLIQAIYSEAGRVIRILGDDDNEQMVALGKSPEEIPAPMREKVKAVFDISVGLYDVAADVGQSFASQREAAFDALAQIFQSAPELLKILGDVWLANADFPGAKEMAKRLKKTLPPHLTGDQTALPPEAEEAMKKMQQQLQELAKELDEKEKIIQSKVIEGDTKERIELQKMESQERIESLKAQVKTLDVRMEAMARFDELQSKEVLTVLQEEVKMLTASMNKLRADNQPKGESKE